MQAPCSASTLRPTTSTTAQQPRGVRVLLRRRRNAAVAASPSSALATAPSSASSSLPPALQHAASVVEQHGGWFAPPLTARPGELLRQSVPFLTQDAGVLPEKPLNLNHALYMYGSYESKYVSVRVTNVHVKLSSWDHAVDTLASAEESRKAYWCSLIEKVRHPDWWPTSGHVPTYDQVIFGRGNASIGLHFDKDNACAGGSRTPVSTYLSICEGSKLVLLLPPGQTLLPAGGDPELLLRPTPELLAAVREAGGYFFVLQDVGQLAAEAQGGSSGSSGSDFSATGLFLPAGWWHWLVGLTPWHVVFGGSFYGSPEEQWLADGRT